MGKRGAPRNTDMQEGRNASQYFSPNDPTVEKLEGISNWYSWHLDIENLLIILNLHEYVYEEIPKEPDAVWKAKAKRAKAVIIANIQHQQQAIVPGLRNMTGPEILAEYESMYGLGHFSPQRDVARTRFYNLKRRPGESLKKFVHRFEAEHTKCWKMGVKLDEDMCMYTMSKGLSTDQRAAVITSFAKSQGAKSNWRALINNFIAFEELDELNRNQGT